MTDGDATGRRYLHARGPCTTVGDRPDDRGPRLGSCCVPAPPPRGVHRPFARRLRPLADHAGWLLRSTVTSTALLLQGGQFSLTADEFSDMTRGGSTPAAAPSRRDPHQRVRRGSRRRRFNPETKFGLDSCSPLEPLRDTPDSHSAAEVAPRSALPPRPTRAQPQDAASILGISRRTKFRRS